MWDSRVVVEQLSGPPRFDSIDEEVEMCWEFWHSRNEWMYRRVSRLEKIKAEAEKHRADK